MNCFVKKKAMVYVTAAISAISVQLCLSFYTERNPEAMPNRERMRSLILLLLNR